MPAIISIVGKSESGKTTVIEQLIAELKSRGYRVATIKHAQDIQFDEEGKDSWRHLQAGSAATVASSPERIVLVRPVTSDTALAELARLLGEDYDIVLAEGFKQSDTPKIEVHRKEIGPPLTDLTRLIAIVTDEPLDSKSRQFAFNDIKGIADLLESGFIKPNTERLALYVNGSPIPLGPFAKEILTNTLIGMATSLKGVGEIHSLEFFLKK